MRSVVGHGADVTVVIECGRSSEILESLRARGADGTPQTQVPTSRAF